MNPVKNTLAAYLHRVGRGRLGAASLSREEAREVFARLLEPGADPVQLGAFLMAERMKGVTAAELAGFVEAARARMVETGPAVPGAVDLPCYAGKRRAPPLHLRAALQARDAGIPVFVHGMAAIPGRLSAWQALHAAGVRRAGGLAQAREILAADGIGYVDVEEACPDLFRILELRPRLGVRTFAHSVARLLNPLACEGQLNGVFHVSYALRLAEANALLGQPRSLTFVGAEGEPELRLDRQKPVWLQSGRSMTGVVPPAGQVPPYPKTAVADVKMRVPDIVGEAGDRVVTARMVEAFMLAASGDLPPAWKTTKAVVGDR